jgi:uncharacterized protein (DUF1919 family)
MKLKDILDLPEIVYERAMLRGTRFAIVSNNCWGYEIYNRLNRPYNTPFVGNFMYPECYLAMLHDGFPGNLPQLNQCTHSKHAEHELAYPVGVLASGAEVHFLHEKTWGEAVAKWQRRSARLIEAADSGCPLFIKICDRDGATKAHFSALHGLNHANTLTLATACMDHPRHLTLGPTLQEATGGPLVDGLTLYRRRYEYMDFAKWLRAGTLVTSGYSRCLALHARLIAALKSRVRNSG